MNIYYIDRKSGKKEREIVAGNRFLNWVYENPTGRAALEIFIKRKIFSLLYGRLQDFSPSSIKIERFVKELAIDMKEAEREHFEDYHSFNDFFARKLKETARPIAKDAHMLISPADGRLLAYEAIHMDRVIQVKGFTYTLQSLLNDRELAEQYEGGTCIVVRLCPADYHRFHFPDSGITVSHKHIRGHYYSVNPIALQKIAEVYCQNKREITIFNTEHFDQMLLVEVGATCVGSIIQTYEPGKLVKKGEEKGCFKFGGSTVLMFLKAGQVKIDKDILDNTEIGIETKVNMGEAIGLK